MAFKRSAVRFRLAPPHCLLHNRDLPEAASGRLSRLIPPSECPDPWSPGGRAVLAKFPDPAGWISISARRYQVASRHRIATVTKTQYDRELQERPWSALVERTSSKLQVAHSTRARFSTSKA